METDMESASITIADPRTGICVRMLGPLTILRNGMAIELPASRKTRALLAYLALSPRAVGRGQLCDLLWDGPNDPRGELRWCLSKLRTIVDEPGRERIATPGDAVELRLDDCFVDALGVASAVEGGMDALGAERLKTLSRFFVGDFVDGLEIDRSPLFTNWLMAQRRRFRACNTAIVEHLVQLLPPDSDELPEHLEKWVELAPLDGRAHVGLLAALARHGRLREGEAHIEATARLFQAEGMEFGPVRQAWRAIRSQKQHAPLHAQAVTTCPAPIVTGGGAPRRASLAVMPFTEDAGAGIRGGRADGLTHDIITRLARLRDFFVIARGSVFALAERNIGPEDAGRRLNVDYVASGALHYETGRVVVRVELVEVRTARIVWAEVFDRRLDSIFMVLDEIGNSIVSSIASEIEMLERDHAILKAPNSLNAWEAYHRGLWHMYRFTSTENQLAQHFFTMAVRQDPTFARAHAGLSVTHWQNAFQRWGDREQEADRAYETAGQSLIVDDHNPAAHWAMGRALWLRGRQDESLNELEKAVDLSPNFALGHYALSFVQSQSGDPAAAIGASDHSRHLSPFDPLLFGMLGARAMAHVRLGQFDEAAEWALKAAARPNAHVVILAIAAHCLALAGRLEEARSFAASIRKTLPHYCSDDFLATFRFTPDAASLYRQGARRIGLE